MWMKVILFLVFTVYVCTAKMVSRNNTSDDYSDYSHIGFLPDENVQEHTSKENKPGFSRSASRPGYLNYWVYVSEDLIGPIQRRFQLKDVIELEEEEEPDTYVYKVKVSPKTQRNFAKLIRCRNIRHKKLGFDP